MFTHSMPTKKGVGVDPERGCRRRRMIFLTKLACPRVTEEESRDAKAA